MPRAARLISMRPPVTSAARCASAALVLSACGMPLWNPPLPPLPTLSEAPLPLGWSLETDIYARILAPERGDSRDHPLRGPMVVAESTVTDQIPASSKGLLPGHWPDAVRASFDSAFADFRRQNTASRPVPEAPARQLSLDLGSPDPTCGVRNGVECHERVTRVRVSAIGFNADSTYAVVYRSMWCGPLCGTGVVFLLRRVPGARWSVWSGRLIWIS
jgi:hypothetical protein